MSALSNLTQTTGSSVTSLPSWYDTAQQNLVSGAQNAAAAAPQLSGTVAQNAVNTLSGPNNPFTTATGTLNSIATGAANPWITNPTTGAVTPNTDTAMGGLFAAQENQLNQLLPTTVAPAEAANIGSGNFGSLRALTATDTAKANALATMQAAQNQAALTNQQTGVSAATGAGTTAQQGITNAMNVGQEQMVAPFTTQANLGNILASINAPATVNTTQTPSTLQSLTGLGTATAGGLNALFASGVSGTSGYNPGLLSNLTKAGSGVGGLATDLKNWWNGSSTPTPTPAPAPAPTTGDGGTTPNTGTDNTNTTPGVHSDGNGGFVDDMNNPVDYMGNPV